MLCLNKKQKKHRKGWKAVVGKQNFILRPASLSPDV